MEVIQHSNISEEVYKNIKNSILTGTFAPGERLIESSIAESLGVSRTPVREAIKKIVAEGFAVEESRKGVNVIRFSDEDLKNITRMRCCLETLAAHTIADSQNQNALGEMEQYIKKMTKALKNKDKQSLFIHDYNFHKALITGANNKWLCDSGYKILEFAFLIKELYYSDSSKEDLECWEAWHTEIVNVIKCGDKPLLTRLISEHTLGYEL